MSKPKSINSQVAEFLTKYRNGSAAALAILVAVMEHVPGEGKGNWQPLARLVMGVDERLRKQMLQIIGKAWPGVRGAVDTDAENGYRFTMPKGGVVPCEDAMPKLKALVDAKVSIFSDDVATWLGKEPKAKAEFNVDNRRESFASSCAKKGLSEAEFRDQLDKMLLDFQAAQHKLAEEARKAA